MDTNLSELLDKDLVRRIEPDENKARALLSTAEKNLKAAADNLASENYDWALAIAYNAMLSAGRALMAFKGYRPVSEAHHLAAVKFCAVMFSSDSSTLVDLFNRYRIKRHDVVYGEAENVGKNEAVNAVENAKKFVEKITEKLASN